MSIDRVLIPDNILDRVEELERQLAELKAGAVTVQVVQVPDGGSGSGLNGWVATGSAFSDLLGRIVLDASLPGIKIAEGGTIFSADYQAGVSGFKIDGGVAEFNNVDVRGALKASVFEYSQMFVTGGTLIIAKGAGKLYADCTSVDSPDTFNVDIEDPDGISHSAAGDLWAVGDIIRLKDAMVGDLWATVSSKTDMTTYWRLAVVKQSPGAGTNYTFREGMAVVNYGQSGQGFLMLTADQSNAPFYSVRTHAGSPWSSQTELARIGNLNGNWGYSSTTYGIALGEYASGKANLTWDPTNGLRLRTHTTTVLQLDNAGNACIAGVLNIGTSGGIYQGTGTFSSPTTGLKIWNDSGYGIIAVYNDSVMSVSLSKDGLRLKTGTLQSPQATLRFWISEHGPYPVRQDSSSPTGYAELMAIYAVSGTAASNVLSKRWEYYYSGTWTTIYGRLTLFAEGPGSHSAIEIYGNYDASGQYGVRIVPRTGVNTYIGSSVDYTGNLRPVRSGNTYTGYIYVPLATPLSHTSLDGDPLNVGTYSVGPVGSGANFVFNYPSAARALAVRLAAWWPSAGGVAYCSPWGSTSYAHVVVRSISANTWNDICGIVATDSTGWITLVVVGENASGIYLLITGYFL